jgi:hypothetical protein
MLADLTHEEWCDWLNAFQQDPWDEARKDDRNAVNALWGIGPYITDDEIKLPGFRGPEYKNDADDIDAALERIKATQKKRALSGELNSKTSDPANH